VVAPVVGRDGEGVARAAACRRERAPSLRRRARPRGEASSSSRAALVLAAVIVARRARAGGCTRGQRGEGRAEGARLALALER